MSYPGRPAGGHGEPDTRKDAAEEPPAPKPNVKSLKTFWEGGHPKSAECPSESAMSTSSKINRPVSTESHRKNSQELNSEFNSPSPRPDHSPDRRRDYSPDRRRGHSPDRRRDHSLDRRRDHKKDRRRDYSPNRRHLLTPDARHHPSNEPRCDHSPSPRRDYSSDRRRDYSSDRRRDHSPSPRRDHSPDRRRDHSPSPRRDHSPDPRRDYSPSPRRDHNSDRRRDHSPGRRRDYSPYNRRDYIPDHRRDQSPYSRHLLTPDTRHHDSKDRRRDYSPSPRHHHSPDRRRAHSPDRRRNHSPDRRRAHSPDRRRNHSPDRRRDHSPDPRRDHSPDRRRDYSPDRRRDHSSDRRRDYSPSPRHPHSPDHRRAHSPDRRRDHSSDRRRDYSPSPRHHHSPDHRRAHSPDRRRDHSPDRRRDQSPDRRRDHSPDPRRDSSPDPRGDHSPSPRRDHSPDPRRDHSPDRRRDYSPSSRRDHSPSPRGSLPPLSELLSKLGLSDLQGGKLTLSSVLEINSNTLSDRPPRRLQELPWRFMKRLIMSNLNARNLKSDKKHSYSYTDYDDDDDDDDDDSDAMNPLDLITAILHCADPFLQQEMVSKMSLCQFAVPLLLPNCDTQKSTLMLWTMRDLVKNYKHHSSSGEGALVEGRIVEMGMPMVSFIKVGESSLCKSQTLNRLLSNHSQHSEVFIHHDMPSGNVPRRISDGLVEVSWYLPCGKKNIDIFTQPVAIANLRGDSRSFKAQVSFLCQVSAAVFIFSDDLEGDLSPFTNREKETELFLVTNSRRKDFKKEKEKLMETCRKYNLDIKMVVRNNQNDSEFVDMLLFHVRNYVNSSSMKSTMVDLASKARQFNVLVDEDAEQCENAKQDVEGISKMVENIVKFKEKQLPLHGSIWKEISQLEKESCRLREASRGTDIEQYINSLKTKENELRKKQHEPEISGAMDKFITGISRKKSERLYFLKWLKIKLDSLTRHDLSTLSQQHKECLNKNPQNKELLKMLNDQISNCSLGPEHFFRELGQIYESTCSLSQHHSPRQQVQHLPRLCAQMLLDGFPVELVDGDASNIPMKWISAVLTELHQLVGTKSRILVLTVLGVQSTGKSTLLNTMFGVQFAVSSGRCTRGAFMLLMKVSEELRPELNCDFIMVIDTEGLKSPELAELDTSYEHDNELATLVIGLSDITIINLAMENNQEMKDILQIAVHAFLRMKEVGKNPRCLFVHQNVSDMSAHDKNMRDREKLVEQLNKMTEAAAKMEKKEGTKFTDVMKYDPDKDSYYIPGLWHGTPPMAPVNTGYSEAVYELKKNLICLFKPDNVKSNDATEFLKWIESLWTAVKYENFIFNFRNSLVADAYLDLCTHYNSWEWTFQSEMNTWLVSKTTMISNRSVMKSNRPSQTTLGEILDQAKTKLVDEENKILEHLNTYFKQKDKNVALVEKYRQDFISNAESLRKQTERSIKQSLEQAFDIEKGMEKITKIEAQQTDTIERKVKDLIQDCRTRETDLSKDDLNKEFDKMWREIQPELSQIELQWTDVYQNSVYLLRDNLSAKAGHVSKTLTSGYLRKSGEEKFTVQEKWIQTKDKLMNPLKHWYGNELISNLQNICNSIITKCCTLIKDHVGSMERNNTDYNDTYIKELLNCIDDRMKDQKISEECEVNLKFHVIGYAAKCFQTAHNAFNVRNDPNKRLEKSKITFRNSFIASFNKKEHCLKKAEEFAETCMRPAVRDYVSKYIGQEIANKMKQEGVIYNTRTNFQFAVLEHLLEEKSFQNYKEYTSSYSTFANKWIKQHINRRMSGRGQMSNLEKKLLSEIVKNVKYVISSSTHNKDIKTFIQQFCSALQNKLVIPIEAYKAFLILLDTNTEQFVNYFKDFFEKMEKSLAKEYDRSSTSIDERIEQLPSKPHDLLFSSVCGCGHQCPFCKTPCEAGGQGHTKHFASMHRPEGLGTYRYGDHGKLVTSICTTSVISDETFKNQKTGGKSHPCKQYRAIYPDWDIAGDSSVEASDYWKYVMKEFNKELAKAHNAEPADIPSGWMRLTEQDALTGLRKSFNMK